MNEPERVTEPTARQSLKAAVAAGEAALSNAVDHLETPEKVALVTAVVEHTGKDPIKRAVQAKVSRASTVFAATVAGILADQPNDSSHTRGERLTRAVNALDEAQQKALLTALARDDAERLLAAAARVLEEKQDATSQDLALETEDVLMRVAANRASSGTS